MTRISDMTPLTELPVIGAYVPVEKTGSTSNYRYDLSSLAGQDALFVSAAMFSVPAETDMVATTGYSVLGVGSALYVYDAAVNAAYVIANPRSSFIETSGRGFRLSLEQDITPGMLGASGDGVADDYPAFQAALDLLPTPGGNIAVLAGTYKLLTTPTWGVKDVRWNISPAATFTGAGAALFLSTARPFDAGLRIDLAANVMTAQINVVSSGTSTLFARPSINVSDGTLLKSATPDFLTPKPLEIIASTILIEPTSKIAINPTPNSLAQAIVVNQTSPLSGTVADQFAFTEFNVIIRSARTPGGIPGNPGSGTWKGLCVSVNAGGANFGGDSVMGGAFGVVQDVADTSTADKNGLASGVQISASTLGKAYGASSGATVTGTGACAALYGYETDVIVDSASVPHAVGFNAWSGGTLQGSATYAAFTLGISGAGGTAKWKTGMRLYTQGGATGSPVDSGFSWFDSDHTTTVGNVFNCSNVTVTGDILYFPNVRLTGAGVLGLNTATSSIGIGNAAPTDTWLKIAASTTTKPHLRLVAGVAPTSPAAGDFWSDGTNLKWVNGSGVTKTVTVT